MPMAQHYRDISFEALDELFGGYRERDFTVRLWDGSVWGDLGHPPRYTLHLKHPGALRSMFLIPSELRMAEAYIYDDYDIEGDIEGVFDAAEHLRRFPYRIFRKLAALPAASRAGEQRRQRRANLFGRRHSVDRDSLAIRYHYDVSNDFYALWLDPRMVYSCAYFADETDGLEAAQRHKLDLICRKLRLQKGEHFLDIGCGWGALMIHAAQHYGVRASGITLSERQAEFARRRIREAGLEDRCSVEIRDYRRMEAPEGFDKIASVGMFEHVGEKKLKEYFQRALSLLKPGGLFLNHGIGITIKDPVKKVSPFIDRYVFPDGELVLINTTLHYAEEAGFEVRHVESLREHYARTLRLWIARLQAQHEAAVACTDEATYRIWRLYMAASAHGFATTRLSIYQSLLMKS